MKVQFFGAAQTVTGSCFMIEAAGSRFAVDCGMHQGNSAVEERNFETAPYRPGDIDFILLTHAHIDHSGLLPRIAADGFSGPVYCTPPTADLIALMLEDSAHIQEMEAAWRSKKISRREGAAAEAAQPLYTLDDARRVPELVRAVEYNAVVEPRPGIRVTYRDAGHILGSSFLEIVVTEDGKDTRLVFSGDLGRPGTYLMHDPQQPAPGPDYLFLESTYGDRNHKNESATLDEMADAVAYSYARGEKVIIPAFAVGRTQEILYCLHLLHRRNRLPADLPIFVDSPLAIRATEIFKKYKDYLDTPELSQTGNVAALLPNLRFTPTAAESQALNTMKGPAVIISASGMCNAGRIRHHLRHNAWRPGASIVIVGYQGVGTPGRKLVDGATSLRLFNEDVAVKARVYTIGGFSAHAGQSQILDWVERFKNDSMQVVLVHGEEQAQKTLAALLESRYRLPVSIPGWMEEMELTPAAAAKVRSTAAPARTPHLDWDLLLRYTEEKMARVRERLQNVGDRPWSEQVEIHDRLLELDKELLSVLTRL